MIFSNISPGNFFNAHQIIEIGGFFILLASIYIETDLSHGFILTGANFRLFTASIFCGTHYLGISLFWLAVLLIAASFPGDITRYFKSKWLVEKFLAGTKSRFLKKEHLGRRNGFYNRNSIWTLNLADPIVWIGTLVLLGYFIGRSYRKIIIHSALVLVGFILISS